VNSSLTRQSFFLSPLSPDSFFRSPASNMSSADAKPLPFVYQFAAGESQFLNTAQLRCDGYPWKFKPRDKTAFQHPVTLLLGPNTGFYIN
jgi:hypothetical protein